MQAATQSECVSVADYLKADLTSDIRHEEYVLVPQERLETASFRRQNGWQFEKVHLQAQLLLNSLQLRLARVVPYEGI